MAKIDHPLFGYLGAYWIEGVPTPFYSLHEAKDYQWANGGVVLDWKGNVLYEEPKREEKELPQAPAVASAGVGIKAGSNWGWLFRLLGKA